MLDKNAFEKALAQDKASSENQAPQQPKNNLQFKVINQPSKPANGKSKREQLWEERMKKKANKISPAFAAPGPVIRNESAQGNKPNISFPGQSNPVPPPQMQEPEPNNFNFERNAPDIQPVGQMGAPPMEPPQQNFGGMNMDNAPISAPSGYPAQNQFSQNQPPPQQFNNIEEPKQEGGFGIGNQEKQKKNNEYLSDWKKEIEEKEMRKKREREEERRKEREEMEKYSNPFGRGGAGAPNRDNSGHVITTRKQISDDNINQNYSQPQQVNQPVHQMNQPVQQMQEIPMQQPPVQQMQQPSVQYQPPMQQPMQQRMPDQNMNQNFGNPYMNGGMQNMNNFAMENPYEFQPPVAPHGQNAFNNPQMYNQRGMTPPANPNMGGGFNNAPNNAYGMQFPNQPVMGGGNMPDPNGLLPQPGGINQSMEVEQKQERVMNNVGRRIMTPKESNEGNALAVGGNQDLLADNKNRMK